MSQESERKVPINLCILPVRLLFLCFATRQGNSYVAVSAHTVPVRMGPLFRRSFQRDRVRAPRRRGWPILFGYG